MPVNRLLKQLILFQFIILFVLLLKVEEADAFNGPKTISPFRKALFDWWNEYHENMINQPDQVWKGFYHSPAASIPLSGWLIERNETWKQDAERQLEYAMAQANPDGLPPALNYPYLTRDGISREGIFVYTAYKILENPIYLYWVDELVLSMIENLKRSPHTYKGKSYLLFHIQYEKTYPYEPVSSNWIDPNQNAEIGLLFTMLYHEPNSLLYQDPIAKEIAYNELSASMALQEETGELSLAERDYLGKYDTGYGTYAIFLWLWVNKYWHDPEFQEHIERGGKWLSQWMTPEHIAEHYYPSYTFNQPWSTEIWLRLGIYYENGIDASNFVNYAYYNQWLDPSTILLLYLAGIPSSIYLVNFSPIVPLEPLPVDGDWINLEATNGIKNSDFERALPGSWRARNAWRDKSTALNSIYSLKIAENGSRDWRDYAYQTHIGVLPNSVYKFIGYSKSISGMAWWVMKIEIYDSRDRLLKSNSRYFFTSTNWTTAYTYFFTPKTATYVNIYFYNRSGTKGRDVFLDRLRLSESTVYEYEDVFDYTWWDRQDLMYNLAVGYIDIWDKGTSRGNQYLYSNLDFQDFMMEWEQTRLSLPAGKEEHSWVIFHADAQDLINHKAFPLVPPQEDYSWHKYKLVAEGNHAKLYRDGILISETPVASGSPPTKGRVGFLHHYGFHFGIRNISMRAVN